MVEGVGEGCDDDDDSEAKDGVGASKQLKCKGEVIIPRLVTVTSGGFVTTGGIFAPNSSTFDVAVIHWLKVPFSISPHLGGLRNSNLEIQTIEYSMISF